MDVPPIPPEAAQYERMLVREAHAQWGLDAPISTFAAQIHQESGWRSTAKSKYASGLAQFTPATAEWISKVYPASLGAPAPYSPGWAIRALIVYNRRLFGAISPLSAPLPQVPDCDRWALALSGYNGGPGWVSRDRKLTAQLGGNPDAWWGEVENHSTRAEWAFRENRDYPRKILLRWESLYFDAGWGGRVCGQQSMQP